MASIIYTPEAIDDVEEVLAFLGQQDQKLVQKFEIDYRKALQRIRDFPQAWPKVGRKVRVKIVSKRFRYGIYYEYFKKMVFIGAVVQLSRHPSYWRRRFEK